MEIVGYIALGLVAFYVLRFLLALIAMVIWAVLSR